MSSKTVVVGVDGSDASKRALAWAAEYAGLAGARLHPADTAPQTASRTAVLWAGPTPTPASAASASLTFAWRALLKIKHVPEQLGDVIGILVMFTLLFTYLFGGALAGSTGDYSSSCSPGHWRWLSCS